MLEKDRAAIAAAIRLGGMALAMQAARSRGLLWRGMPKSSKAQMRRVIYGMVRSMQQEANNRIFDALRF